MENKFVIDIYNTFEIFDNAKGDLNKKYLKVLTEINNLSLLVSSSDFLFMNSFLQVLDERRRKKDKELSIKTDFLNRNIEDYSFTELNKDNPFPSSENEDLLYLSQLRALHHYFRMSTQESKYTNLQLQYTTKNHLLLFPIKVKMKNGKIGFVDVYLTLYKHGYAIINGSFRLENYEVDDINLSTWTIDIQSAYLPAGLFSGSKCKDNLQYKKIGRCTTLQDSVLKYVEFIQKKITKYPSNPHTFHSLTLLKTKDQPVSFNETSQEYNENIFKLLFSPVTDLSLEREQIKEKIEFYSKVIDNNTKIYVNGIRLIHCLSKNIYSRITQDEFTEKAAEEVLYAGYKSEVTFALEKLLLRKYTLEKFVTKSLNQTISLEKLSKILMNRDQELRYETNQLFFDFATTRELIDFLFEKGVDDSQKRIIRETEERVKGLIILKREILVNKITIMGTILALYFTAIFSYEGIQELLLNIGIDEEHTIKVYFSVLIFLAIMTIWIYKDTLIIRPYWFVKRYIFHIRGFFANIKNQISQKWKEK